MDFATGEILSHCRQTKVHWFLMSWESFCLCRPRGRLLGTSADRGSLQGLAGSELSGSRSSVPGGWGRSDSRAQRPCQGQEGKHVPALHNANVPGVNPPDFITALITSPAGNAYSTECVQPMLSPLKTTFLVGAGPALLLQRG